MLPIALTHAGDRRVLEAILALRERLRDPTPINALADAAHMSPSTFHRQFKAVTAMTPLQYQKQLRLLEARRLMITSSTNVEHAAFQVGYESSSHFSRDYTRMFGTSPRREVFTLKAELPSVASSTSQAHHLDATLSA